MADLSRKRERERLKARREPYWMRLHKGQYLGFRAGAETWHVRLRDRRGNQHQSALPSAVDYDDAKMAAEKWVEQMGSAPARGVARGTVRQALEAYLKWLAEQGRDMTVKTITPKFKKTVWNDPIADIALHTLVEQDMSEWRDRLRPGRQPRSINRVVRDVQAGLNRALKKGFVGDRAAWTLDPLADDVEEGGDSVVILSQGQRKALIENATPAAAAFLRGLELTGARPGELAAATVGDFDARHGTLRLMHRKGRPARLRARSVVLSSAGTVFFTAQSKNKLPAAPLFVDPDGRPWQRKRWAEEIRFSAAIVNSRAKGKNRIPARCTAYGFRHARISELLQVHGVDPLTVASQTGTSIRMIEIAYFKFIAPALREKLALVDEG